MSNMSNLEIQKPNFIIIGSAKCGTTALASILDCHPDCCMSRPKEVSFFLDTIDYKQNNPNYEKGWDWYQQAFTHYNGERMIGEATPNYASRTCSPGTAKRIYEFNPAIKIIYMVRDPLERQLSAWKMQYSFGKTESLSCKREHQWAIEGLDYWMQKQRDSGQWNECRYGYQLAAYEEFVTAENICVSFLEDWKHSKTSEVERIVRFLGLEPSLLAPDIQENANRGADRQIERLWLKEIRTNPVVRSIVQQLPPSWRDWSRKNVAKSAVVYPTVPMSQSIQDSFIQYVADDSIEFLHRYGKSLDLWHRTLGAHMQANKSEAAV